jgi:hypothetical protein
LRITSIASHKVPNARVVARAKSEFKVVMFVST